MISLSTNVSDLILQRTLQANTISLNELIKKMTSGYKINHAKDNAAGYSIAKNLSVKISSLSQVQSNTENGISLLNYAQDALGEIQNQLSKLRDLAIQAANGVYDVTSRDAIQAEADQILEQIAQIRENTEFDGQKLFYAVPKTLDTDLGENDANILGLSASPKSGLGLISPLVDNPPDAEDEEDYGNTGAENNESNVTTDSQPTSAPKSIKKAGARLLGASPTITG